MTAEEWADNALAGCDLDEQGVCYKHVVRVVREAQNEALERAAEEAEVFLHSLTPEEEANSAPGSVDRVAAYSNGTVRRVAAAIRALKTPESEKP